jgi:DNA-binding NtrC family response regulator
MAEDNFTNTLVEEESHEGLGHGTYVWLIGIGSAEDAFASAGRVITLDDAGRVRFGRTDDDDQITVDCDGGVTDVGIPFGWVSGRHAELEITRGLSTTLSLRDLGSRNGTLVNGERVEGSVRLRPGDVFEVGRSFWMVREVRIRKHRTNRMSELDPTGTCNPHLHHVHRTLHRLAGSSIPIVLRGETGTGKEYLARAIHRVSGRTGPFCVANLAAMSEDRVERLLFGDSGKPGLFEEADGGTLMLDELAELSPAVQAKLLSAIAEGRAARVGEQAARHFDVRLLACTLHDLSRMVDAGRFRPDLYSRLAGFVAELPPLRARREDLGLLVRVFVQDLQREGRPTRVTSNAFRRILSRAWPFNVRQLHQTLTTASLLASGDGTITADALAEILEEDDGLPQSPDEVRRLRAELVRNLAQHSGDTDQVARAMNKDPYLIHRWLERFALQPESYRA